MNAVASMNGKLSIEHSENAEPLAGAVVKVEPPVE